MSSELIRQYFEENLGKEDMQLLVELVSKDQAETDALIERAASHWQSLGRDKPTWPSGVADPDLGRKGMGRLYAFAGFAAALVLVCVSMMWMLTAHGKSPLWSETAGEARQAVPVRLHGKEEAKPAARKRPKAAKEEIQVGPNIHIDIAKKGTYMVSVSTLDGESVRPSLYSGPLEAGTYKFPWDGLDKHSRLVTPGSYRVEVRLGGKRVEKFRVRLTRDHLRELEKKIR